mmetsp:Transcript_43139/g.134814  ORF Transcript_43139/g.134814 Transcript_43139/m.134814 type:complete len:397 (+) Transcript_43139:1-1191(+)
MDANATLGREGFLLHKAGRLRDHPPGADYSKETVMVDGGLSITTEAFFAFLWILMVCALPLVAFKLEGRRLTRSEVGIFGIMWIAFVGGIYLFTNILLFESVHFEGVRSLTIVECVYLFTQMLTTVGYGDIVPARPRAQVFVGLYVLFFLMIIANVLSDISCRVAEHTEDFYKKMRVSASQLLLTLRETENDESVPTTSRTQAKETLIKARIPALPWTGFVKHLLSFSLWCAMGIVFFTRYPGEGRTTSEAIYMSIVTLSTVGFGVYTPLTEAGKVFGSFWMLFGSGTLVALVGSFTELVEGVRVREKFFKEFRREELQMNEAFQKLPERCDLHDFMRFAMLYSDFVEERKLDMIQDTFYTLGPGENEKLDKEAVVALLEKLDQSTTDRTPPRSDP